MNIIAAPKIGKSWLVTGLALALPTGRLWLNTFESQQGQVLLIDHELHAPTIANRIPKVADARGNPLSEYGEQDLLHKRCGPAAPVGYTVVS